MKNILRVGIACVAFALTAQAQDTRTVTEPKYPADCVVLYAKLAAHNGMLSAADERKLDTTRLQQAIDGCKSGGAVHLKSAKNKNIFLTAPIELHAGVTLLVDGDVAVFASRNPRDYDATPNTCAKMGDNVGKCKPLILADHAPGSGIMGEGVIDGRGGTKLLGQEGSWWDLAHLARIDDEKYSSVGLVVAKNSDNFTLYKITLRNAPNYHVSTHNMNGFTAWGVKVDTPHTARNTDGIDPSDGTTNVTIAHSWVRAGDDDIAIKSSDTGGGATNMTIEDNHFYSGHGMSIGSGTSGGVSNILVRNLTIDGADNGIRIKSDKSRGGLVKNVVYEDVCIRNSPNPIILNPYYTTFDGKKIPVYRDIALKNVHALTSGNMIFAGLDPQHRLGVTLDNVVVDGWQPQDVTSRFTEVNLSGGGSNLKLSGEDVHVVDSGNTASSYSCDGKFVAYAENTTSPQSAEKVLPEDKTLYVAADGTGDYYLIQKAIDAAPATGALIMVGKGVYREVLHIDKPNIQLRSADPDPSKTVIVNNRNALENGGTFNSATVNVTGDNFYAENMTFENDYNKTHDQKTQGSQALALSLTGDRAVFRNMHLLGNQDTLYAESRHCATLDPAQCTASRSYFVDCLIAGNVDFIFGDGDAVFDHCEIRSTVHEAGGYLTAQSRISTKQDSAYVFNHCKLTAEQGASYGKIYLGRPWRPYAKVIFMNTEMGAHIAPTGWREWHPGETHSLETVYYAEFNSSGPGAYPNQRDPHTKLLTAKEASLYETKIFLKGTDNWDPTTVK